MINETLNLILLEGIAVPHEKICNLFHFDSQKYEIIFDAY